MVEVFKIMNNKYDPEVSSLLIKHSNVVQNRPTRRTFKKLFKKRARLDIMKSSFSHRIVNVWNHLPEEVVSAPTMITFENRLDTFWSKQDITFNFEATIDLIHADKIATGTLTADQDLNIEVR